MRIQGERPESIGLRPLVVGRWWTLRSGLLGSGRLGVRPPLGSGSLDSRFSGWGWRRRSLLESLGFNAFRSYPQSFPRAYNMYYVKSLEIWGSSRAPLPRTAHTGEGPDKTRDRWAAAGVAVCGSQAAGVRAPGCPEIRGAGDSLRRVPVVRLGGALQPPGGWRLARLDPGMARTGEVLRTEASRGCRAVDAGPIEARDRTCPRCRTGPPGHQPPA